MVKRAALSLRSVLLIAIGLSWFSGAMADLSDGLVAYYPFDGNAQDASGNGNHGIETGDSRYIDGIVNQARHFDRNDGYEYILIPNILKNDGYSVSLWVNLEKVGSHNSLLMLNEGSSWEDSNFWLFTSHHRIAVLQGEDLRYENGVYGTLRTVFEDSEKLSDKTPYFMVANYKEGTLTLFLNGNVYAQYTGVAPIQNTSTQLNIGVSPSSTGRYQVEGFIDELRIYNRVLSESEVQQLYQMNNQPEPPLDNCWATYENGNLHIPCIKVKVPFDDDLHYEGDMQYEPLSDPMSFQVTGAKPK